MALKAIVDEEQFGELDETVREHYQEQDGKYVLTVDGVEDFPSIQALKNGHQRSKEEKRKLREQLDGVKGRFGPLVDVDDLDLSSVDPERFQELLPYITGEQEIPEPGEKQNKVDVDKIKSNAVKPYEKKLSEAQEELETTRARLNQHIRDSALTEALSKTKVAEPYFDAAMAMFRPRIKVMEDEGKLIPVIDDEAAGEMPVDKFIKEWATTDQGKAFIEATGNNGGGARGGGDKGQIKNPWDPKNRSVKEQNRIYKENPERARQMAALHGVSLG